MSYCNWSKGDPLMEAYHDTEWGVPLHDDKKLFEFLMMESLQCGLSWMLMLKKREIFRECFAGFDYKRVARFTEKDLERILSVPGMLRSPRKIMAVIQNAKSYEAVCEEFGSFDAYLWRFTEGKTVLYKGHGEGWIPVSNQLSHRIAADLKKRGFRYLGSITVYSFLQACGVINDHGENCACYEEINRNYPTVTLPCCEEIGSVQYN